MCESIGLNPMSMPFEYIAMRGPNNTTKLVLYPSRNCADQLAEKHNLSWDFSDVHEDTDRGVAIVWCHIKAPSGRTGKDFGIVSLTGYSRENGKFPLTGDMYNNALLKLHTKARRRAVLAFQGLGYNDASENNLDILEAQHQPVVVIESQQVDTGTGEIVGYTPPELEAGTEPEQMPPAFNVAPPVEWPPVIEVEEPPPPLEEEGEPETDVAPSPSVNGAAPPSEELTTQQKHANSYIDKIIAATSAITKAQYTNMLAGLLLKASVEMTVFGKPAATWLKDDSERGYKEVSLAVCEWVLAGMPDNAG